MMCSRYFLKMMGSRYFFTLLLMIKVQCKPLVSLVMIVKDEARGIVDTIASVRGSRGSPPTACTRSRPNTPA